MSKEFYVVRREETLYPSRSMWGTPEEVMVIEIEGKSDYRFHVVGFTDYQIKQVDGWGDPCISDWTDAGVSYVSKARTRKDAMRVFVKTIKEYKGE